MKRGSKPKWVRELAGKRIAKLLALAKNNFRKHPERARRYVELARKLSSRYNVTLTREQKKKICKKCDAFLVPGTNVSVRNNAKTKTTVYTCLECGNKMRFGYS